MTFTTRILPVTPFGPDQELAVLDGGGRLVTDYESRLLERETDHADHPISMLPYTYQSGYGREAQESTQRIAVLDNGTTRAEFLLDQGGRLWSLRDVESGKECLHTPDSIQMANLGLRNGWFAGGVEWNLGVTGHWALTATPVSAGIIDGRVLRMWAYERQMGMIWRLDAYLPEGSSALYTHVALHNPHDHDALAYWWSNAAVPQEDGTRVLVDSTKALHFGYQSQLREVPIPVWNDRDVSWPSQHDGCADYFFRQQSRYPWIASVDATGYGLGQASTPNLKGRKLFTWGNGVGGKNWQRWLSADKAYAEIQSGLAYTQLEYVRLSPDQSLRFTELYRPIQLTTPTTSPWDEVVKVAHNVTIDENELQRIDQYLTDIESSEATEVTWAPPESQGWGALEVAAGHLKASRATPFDRNAMTEEQKAWLNFKQSGDIQPVLQRSAIAGSQWLQELREAKSTWIRDLLLGFTEYAAGNTEAARKLWKVSIESHPTADALRAFGLTSPSEKEAAEDLLAAHAIDPDRVGITIELLTALIKSGDDQKALQVSANLSETQRKNPRVQYLTCLALVNTGETKAAEKLLNLPLTLPDLREGDTGLDQLWTKHQALLGTNDPIPTVYDFRMQTSPAPTQ